VGGGGELGGWEVSGWGLVGGGKCPINLVIKFEIIILF
jgi:hypothetical protein